jgi:hypothetical protein
VNTRRYVVAQLVSAAIIVAAVGCGTQQPAAPQASSSTVTSASAAPAPPPAVSQFDAQWMGVLPDQPQGWQELNRRITGDFQQFSLRPTDETEYRYGCNGCAPWTVDLTAYAPGKFDPAEARTGLPVTVNADRDGFLVEDQARHAATLTWQYADDAWATVRGMTSATIELDRMVDLAHALQPTERTPIRLPLTMGNMPANMPLAELNVDTSPLQDDGLDYGTRLEFTPCGIAENGGVGDCRLGSDELSVHIWPDDYRTPTGGLEHMIVALNVGGREGLYDELIHEAAVQLAPGMHVEFQLSGPSYPDQRAGFEKILAGVSWAPDPGNDATWPAVTDWAK